MADPHRQDNVLEEHELPENCPTCGMPYDQVITTTGRYSGIPRDSDAVIIHVVRNMVPERGWDFGIFLHESPILPEETREALAEGDLG